MSHILLVDDEPGIRDGYGRVLARRGHTVEMAGNGRDALTKVAATSFGAIITDIRMPEMDGVEFLRRLRMKDLDVPVLLMTGSPGVESATKAVEYGAFCYLAKPVDPQALVDAVTNALHLHVLAQLKREALVLLGAEARALGDRASREARFEAALSSLRMAFQPIVSVRQRQVVGYEALLRSQEKTLARPDHFLDAAERLGRVSDLGRVVRAVTAQAAAALPPEMRLFINLHASDLMDDELLDPTSPLSALSRRVILEITERASLEDVKDPRGRVALLREMGFRIAVDDLGAGFAGLSTLAHLEPEVVKLDMSLVRDVHQSAAKQRIIRSIFGLCEEMEIESVVEGVETAMERDCLLELGCDLCQGYFFGRPVFELQVPPATVWP